MKRLIACLILLPSLAFAQNNYVRDVIGNAWIPWQADPNGTGFITERYPRETKWASVPLATGATLAAGATGETGLLSAIYPSSSLQMIKALRVQCTGWTFPDSGGVHIIFQESIDGITFAPSVSHRVGQIQGPLDTLQIVLDGTNPELASPGVWIRFNEPISITLPYYRLLVKNRLFTAGGTITYTIEAYGRQY